MCSLRPGDRYPGAVGDAAVRRAEPRPLNAAERQIATALLTHAEFDGREALLRQVEIAQVVAHCACGCATVEIEIEDAQRTHGLGKPIPNEGIVLSPDGIPIGEVMLFTREGELASLEIWSNFDEPIFDLPPLSQLRISVGEDP